jgi:hypothetical protein
MQVSSLLQLPDRPIKIVGGADRRGQTGVFWSIICLLFAAAFAAWQGPGLLRDLRINADPLVLTNGEVRDGRCSTKVFFAICNGELAYSLDGTDHINSVSMAFVDFRLGDYETAITVAKADPSLATMSIGIDKIWNRLITFAVLVLGMAIIAWKLFSEARRIKRSNLLLIEPAKLRVIPVEVKAVTKVRRDMVVRFDYTPDDLGENPVRHNLASFSKEQSVLTVPGPQGANTALAVKHPDAAIPVLLDSALERLDLSAEERRAALASIGRA